MNGTHERAPDGFLLAYGTVVEPGRHLRGSIVDVTPTVLDFLGLPVGRDTDGYARADLFKSTFTTGASDCVCAYTQSIGQSAVDSRQSIAVDSPISSVGVVQSESSVRVASRTGVRPATGTADWNCRLELPTELPLRLPTVIDDRRLSTADCDTADRATLTVLFKRVPCEDARGLN